jgi:hypothetical protein
VRGSKGERSKRESFVRPVNRKAIICKKWLFLSCDSYNTCLRTPILQLLHIWYMEFKLEKLETGRWMRLQACNCVCKLRVIYKM